MEFRVLGPVEFAAEGRRLSLGSAHQRRVLAVLLAARGEVVSTDRLIDAVWGPSPPPSAKASLHSHVSRLRRILSHDPGARDVLVTAPDGYRFALGTHDLDAQGFEAGVAAARQVSPSAPEQIVAHLDAALERWRGRAYGELADHELIRPEALRLDTLRATALADRIDARLALGQHQAVLGELEALVAADPLAERPTAQLMRALVLAGRQADALAAYGHLRRRLADELGVDPAPEMQRLHAGLLRHDADLFTGSMAARPVAVRGPTLPAAAGEVVGRDAELAEIAALVTTTRLVTLTGPGGVGKTTLAHAVRRAVGEGFPDGVVWCGLAGLQDPASVPAALVEALGVRSSVPSSDETLAAALGTRRLLVVLDGCEHLLEAVVLLVERIRSHGPEVSVLTTSREYLRLPGERVVEVAPLPVPAATADAAAVAATPAGQLLCARARAVEPSFALTDANARTLAALCRRLDGIPLALELAAARLRALSPEALAARLDQRFEVLTGGPRGEGGRHRTLEAVVEWSYGLLTDAEARLFDRLAVFAGAFSLAAAEQIGAEARLAAREVAGVLAELVDKSLVVVERRDGQVRYRLLDTLRAYGQRRLEVNGTVEEARRAHADYHVHLVEALAPALRGAEEAAALATLDSSVDDLRSAHAWLMATGAADRALRLSAALHDELVFRPREEAFGWVDRALGLAGAADQPSFAAALATAARGAMNRGVLDEARRLAESALATAGPDQLAVLWARYVLTTVALYEGRLDDALRQAEMRLELADALAEPYHRSLAGVSRALALHYRGEGRAAVAAAGQAHRDAEASGNHTARAWALYSSGEVLLDTDPDQAAARLEQAIDAARRVDRRFITGVALVSLASLHARNGRTGQALALFRETIAHWRSLGVQTQQLTTLRNLVDLLIRCDADEAAAVLYGAVTAAATPSFGVEADRLADAWRELEARLGPAGAAETASRGRFLSPAALVDRALAELDDLLGTASPA